MKATGETLTRGIRLRWSWAVVALMSIIAVPTVIHFRGNRPTPSAAPVAAAPVEEAAASDEEPAANSVVRVETVRPAPGGLERESRQPGTVRAFEWAALYAKVPGFLKTQNVDIGDHVKRGQLLAEIDAPEVVIAVNQAAAALSQAQAQVGLMNARVATAHAKWQAAMATVAQSDADLARAVAQRHYQEKQFQRIKHLFELNSIDEKLVDERQDDLQAALASEQVAKATIVTTKADADAAAAQVDEAKADVVDAKAKVQVAQAALDRAMVLAGYLRITSPFDGVITERKFHRGDFIREAERSGEQPLFEVQRTEVMRVVVQVPDRDVPLCDAGDEALVQIDALPGEIFKGTVARMAQTEDGDQKTMRTEIDLRNPHGRIKEGMYGLVTIKLRPPADPFTVPASCLVGSLEGGKGSVYVIRGGKACLVPVVVAADDGVRFEICKGLQAGDQVVSRPHGAIANGTPVEVIDKDR